MRTKHLYGLVLLFALLAASLGYSTVQARPLEAISVVNANIGTAESKTTGTSLRITTTSAITAGDTIVVTIAMDPVAGTVRVRDVAGNTYTSFADVTNDPDVRTLVFAAFNVKALASGSAIRIDHPSLVARAATASVFRGLAPANAFDQQSTGIADGSRNPSSGATPVTTQPDELLIGAIGIEGPDGDTPGTWQNSFTAGPRRGTTGGGGGSNITINMGYRIVSATGSYTAAQSLPAARDSASAIATFKMDISAPTVTVDQAAGQSDPTSASPINFTAVFSRAINTATFASGDVTLGGTAPGTLSALVTEIAPNNGTTFNIAVSGMTGSGTVTASIPANAVQDSGGINNAASTSTDNSVTYNPAVLDVSVEQAAGQPDPTSTSPVNFTALFSRSINTATFIGADVTLSGTAGATTALITEVAPNNGTTFNIAVSGMTGSGTVTASIAANAVQDTAGIGNTASSSADNTVTYDIGALDPTVNQAAGQFDPTNASPVNFTAVFNKAINTATFASGDVTLGGTAGATTAVVSEVAPNNGTTFNIAVSGMTGSGTVTASIAANMVQDSAGNNNAASTSTDNTVTFDSVNPTVAGTSLVASYTTGPSTLTVTFSKNVSNAGGGADPDDAGNPANYLLVEDGANGAFDTVSCSGGLKADDTQFTVNSVVYNSGLFTSTLTINGGVALPDGKYRLFVCGTTSIVDGAGNPLNGGVDSTFTFTVQAAATGGGGTGSGGGRGGTGGSGGAATLPVTGFPQGKVTELPLQPAEKAYASTDLLLEIPKLKQKLTILGVPLVEGSWDVSWLGNNAGWLDGSAFPTWAGNSVLTGHVWDAYNRPGPFAGLKTLKYGDQVKVHAFGQVFTYEVVESSLVSSRDVKAVLKHEEKPHLTLLSCEQYDPATGKYTFRRMVRAVLVSVK